MIISRALLAVAASCFLFLTSCGEGPLNELQKPANLSKTLKIAYFWTTSSNPYGYASVKAGVRAAVEAEKKEEGDNPGDFHLLNYVQFEEREDPETQEKADEVARSIRRDPDILAVIGHTASGTTFAALPRYAEAGIPVLIPSATSPYLLYRHPPEAGVPKVNLADPDYTAPRFSNVFRLTPSDVPDQAHAMELVIKQKPGMDKDPGMGKNPRVLLICDATKESGAEIYSKPICDYLDAAKNKKEGHYDVVGRINLDRRLVLTILPEIHSAQPDFIVVASYPSLARLVLQVWGEDQRRQAEHQQDKTREAPPPQFIMPDACLAPELLKPHAEIYVTYPMNPDHTEQCDQKKTYKQGICAQKMKQLHLEETDIECSGSNFEPTTKDKSGEKRNDAGKDDDKDKNPSASIPSIHETDEMFAYDSVRILTGAVRQCVAENDLNRACVLVYLNQHHDSLKGICETYHIEHGDRQNAYYYVYKNVPDPTEQHSDLKENEQAEGGRRIWAVQWFAKEDDYELTRAPSSTSH
jgi:hypothetical protein